MRRIGVLMTLASNDPDAQSNIATFLQALQQLGWTDGRNLRIDFDGARAMPTTSANTQVNWPGSGRTLSSPLAARPWGHYFTRPSPCQSCSRRSQTRSALVSSLAWRARAATLPALCSSNTVERKWVELLKEIAPRVARAAVLWDPSIPAGIGQFAVIQTVAPSVDVGGSASQRARSIRNGGGHRDFCAFLEWRPDRDSELIGEPSSRINRRTRGSVRLPAVYPAQFYILKAA